MDGAIKSVRALTLAQHNPLRAAPRIVLPVLTHGQTVGGTPSARVSTLGRSFMTRRKDAQQAHTSGLITGETQCARSFDYSHKCPYSLLQCGLHRGKLFAKLHSQIQVIDSHVREIAFSISALSLYHPRTVFRQKITISLFVIYDFVDLTTRLQKPFSYYPE
jgi:hypothetical protein